jgi:hypothetical protein
MPEVYINILLKNEGQEGKRGLFWNGNQWEEGRHKERVNEGGVFYIHI